MTDPMTAIARLQAVAKRRRGRFTASTEGKSWLVTMGWPSKPKHGSMPDWHTAYFRGDDLVVLADRVSRFFTRRLTYCPRCNGHETELRMIDYGIGVATVRMDDCREQFHPRNRSKS